MNRSFAAAALVACAVPTAAVAATTLSMTNGSVVEQDSGMVNLEFFVTRSGDLTNDVNVGLFTVSPSGNAVAGEDYVPVPFGTRVVIPAGSPGVQFSVQVRGDLDVEPNEVFTVALNSAYEVDGAARTLAAVQQAALPATPDRYVIADIDGDSRPDVVASRQAQGQLFVLRNTTVGETISFAAARTITLAGPAGGLAVADFDGDGSDDIAASLPAANQVVILRNTSTAGTVAFAAPVTKATGAGPSALAVGDYDDDGQPDLVAANSGASTVSLLSNQSTLGQIAFADAVDDAGGTNPVDVALADLDDDGLPDLITTTLAGTDVLVRHNTCCAGAPFAAAQPFALPAVTSALAVGDVDGDGLADLVASNTGADSIAVLRNTSTVGSVSFATQQGFAAGESPRDISLGDIDGDGLPEVVTTISDVNFAGGISVLANDSTAGTPAFLAPVPHTGLVDPMEVAVIDINGDGFADVTHVADAAAFGVLRNKGTDVALAPATFTANIFNNDARPVPDIGAVTPLTLLGLLGLLLLRSSRRRNTA